MAAIYRNKMKGWAVGSGGVPQTAISNNIGLIENLIIRVASASPIFALKSVAVPIGDRSGLGAAFDPIFDPSQNPWWGVDNLWKKYQGIK